MDNIPNRDEIRSEDRWNLGLLYAQPSDWEKDYQYLMETLPSIAAFKGTLGQSASQLCNYLQLMYESEQKLERVGTYAHLKYSEQMDHPESLARLEKITYLVTQWTSTLAFFYPELQAIDPVLMQQFLDDPILKDYVIVLEKILRHRPHILSEKEEQLLAMQGQFSDTPAKAFQALVDVDISFGQVETPEGMRDLSQTSFITFLQNPVQAIRKTAYKKFYHAFDSHKNTLAQLLAGNVYQDVYTAKARHHSSARASALFQNNVHEEVYDELISCVRTNLPLLHRYYTEMKRILKLPTLAHYDVYTNLIPSVTKHTTYAEAVDLITESLKPLGEDYVRTMRDGLINGGWVDKYENKGKRSGAFSSGCYRSSPYILMNYRADTFNHVFTLTHEAGHSMHSWLAGEHNLSQDYQYSIFEAEIASTFHEHLLSAYLLAHSDSPELRFYLIMKQLQDMVATFFRQTMFAEFEHIIHQTAEKGEGLTLDIFRSEYNKLLSAYFGPEVDLPEVSSLECLRIPHFYHSFYVYQYATGISAATCFAHRVLNGESPAQYLDFLKRGGRSYPIQNLEKSGVKISDALQETITVLSSLLDEMTAA